MSEIRHMAEAARPLSARSQDNSFADFPDPDGTGWSCRRSPAAQARYRESATHAGSWSLPSPECRLRRSMKAPVCFETRLGLSQTWSKSS